MNLAAAAISAGVRRFDQVSAVGVESGRGNFSSTKARGEAALASLDIDGIVIRPGLVFAPAAYGGWALQPVPLHADFLYPPLRGRRPSAP